MIPGGRAGVMDEVIAHSASLGDPRAVQDATAVYRTQADGRPYPGQSFITRLLGRCEVQDTGCWEWRARTSVDGYGRIRYGGAHTSAHRALYQALFGPLDRAVMVCHHCDNPPCCNPVHLFTGTASDNAKDSYTKGRSGLAFDGTHGASAVNAAKTHCRHGHPFDEANTYVSVGASGAPRRACRACGREKVRRYQARKVRDWLADRDDEASES